MTSGKSKQFLGYNYKIGCHFVPFLAPYDALHAIKFQDKTAWQGEIKAGSLNINRPDQFGGKEKEGGIVGKIDVMDGNSAQAPNSYLQSVLGSLMPAFRGVSSVVFNQLTIGKNPFLKPVSFKGRCVYNGYDDWKHDKAGLCGEFAGEGGSYYIAIDNSQSMTDAGYIDTAKDALKSWLDRMRGANANIRLVAFSAIVDAEIECLNCTAADYDAMKAWVDALPAPSDGPVELEPVLENTAKVGTSVVSHESIGINHNTPQFASFGWPSTNYNNLTISSETVADETNNYNSGGNAHWVWDIDVSEIPAGTALTYEDVMEFVVKGNPYSDTGSFVSNVTMSSWNGSTWNQFGLINHIQNTPTTSASYPRSLTKNLPAGAQTLRIYVGIPAVDAIAGRWFTYNLTVPSLSFTGPGVSDWEAAVDAAPTFFGAPTVESGLADEFESLLSPPAEDGSIESQRALIFLSEGEPYPVASASAAQASLDGIQDLDRFAYNIVNTDTQYSALIDNTSEDGIPILDGTDVDAISTMFAGLSLSWLDINPVHHLRELYLDPLFGGSDDVARIGASYAAAADQIFSEGFGVSVLGNPSDRDSIIREIERTIDARTYIDRATGLEEITLIRDDYDAGTLFTVDKSNVDDWGGIDDPRQDELPNQFTLVYTKRVDGSTASVTLHNIAAIQELGGVIPDEDSYPMISCPDVAVRVAERELVARTVPLRRGRGLKLLYLPHTLNIGSPINIDLSAVGHNETIVARILDIDDGDSRTRGVTISWVEDKFSITSDALVGTDGGAGDVVIDRTALPAPVTFVQELPYYLGVIRFGQSEVDDILTADPDAGYLAATAGRPNGMHLDAVIAWNNGSDWVEIGTSNLAPWATLDAAVSRVATQTSILMAYNTSLELVSAGMLCSVGTEIMRVDSMVRNGDQVTLTVGRACLDTSPVKHEVGDYVIFFNLALGSDEVERTGGENLTVRMLPRTYEQLLSPDLASDDLLAFDSRAIRPYPPGDFKADGGYNDGRTYDGSVDLTWAHRDRTIQTTSTVEDHLASDIGPEAGTTYQVRVREYDDADALISTLVDTNVGSVTSHTVNPTPSANAIYLDFEVASIRGGHESFQAPVIRMLAGTVRTTEVGDARATENNLTRTLEA